MLGLSSIAPDVSMSLPWSSVAAAAAPSALIAPALVLALCVVAGIGTVLLLPGRREASWRKIGGVLVAAAGLILAAALLRHAAGSPTGSGVGTYFWIFSAIALFGALRVITHPRPVYSALYFVLTVFASAGLFVLMWAEFMAAALVLIYAGAILITYLFVIMLATEATVGSGPMAGLSEADVVSREPLAASAIGFTLLGVLLFLIFDKLQLAVAKPVADGAVSAAQGTTQALGEYLVRYQAVNLELAGLILALAMIGAIVIARRKVSGVSQMSADLPSEVVVGPSTPIDDDPHSIPVYGTDNPRQKEFPER